VAKIIYVLCTDMSSYVNGAENHINGGQRVKAANRRSPGYNRTRPESPYRVVLKETSDRPTFTRHIAP